MWPTRLDEPFTHARHSGHIAGRLGAEQAVDVEVEQWVVPVNAEPCDPPPYPLRVREQLVSVDAEEGWGVDQPMRDDVDLLQNHFVGVSVPLFARLRVDGHSAQRLC